MPDFYAMEREDVGVYEDMTGWRSFWLVRWGRTKIVNPLMLILQRGTEPKQLAFSAALGFTLGVFPIYGVTALLCGVAIAALGNKINGPTLILANLLATPFEFSLMIPFLRIGETLVGASSFPLTKDALWQAISGKASGELLHAIGHALLGWLVAGPFLCVALYFTLVPVIKWSQQQLGGQDRVPSERVVLLNEEVLLGKKDLGE
ncbi:hypothetical protein KC19_3G226600 [Ceratodon purpureus]|uniref:DUF2062 domain-containing protein n=1 Tax=Ceratodon purpureus TaxID=3225 RepID=A0A8T0IPX7_CERPU|nr:hypothetical protein KC19_3G226600 [Ceratodon purpureus]